MMRVIVAAFVLLSTAANAGGTNYLFPDLVPFVTEDEIYLQNWDISSGEIRLETVYANFGDGLFEIRSGQDIGGGQIEVLQRVYINNDFGGEFEDFVINAGLANHQSHGHIHFEEFSRFSLHEVTKDNGVLGVGDEVAASLKSSYSLSANRGPLLPEYAGAPKYTSSNNGIAQRISVGYGDRYSRTTEGQHFSIADVPVGPLYWLRQHVDPSNHAMETDETNNVFEILINLNQQGVGLLKADGTFFQPGDAVTSLPGVTGDFNGDTVVDGDDWNLFAASLGSSLSGEIDMNNDGSVNHADFLLFKQAYESANPGSAFGDWHTSVPEPPGIALLITSLALGFIRANLGTTSFLSRYLI